MFMIINTWEYGRSTECIIEKDMQTVYTLHLFIIPYYEIILLKLNHYMIHGSLKIPI